MLSIVVINNFRTGTCPFLTRVGVSTVEVFYKHKKCRKLTNLDLPIQASICAYPRGIGRQLHEVLSLISRASAGHCTFTEIFTALSVWLHPCLALDQSLASLKLCHSIVYYTKITTYCQELFFTYLKNFFIGRRARI